MASIHIRMGYAAEDSEFVAVFLEHFKVGRRAVIATAILGEEMFRQQTEVVANAKHSARLSAGRDSRGEPMVGGWSKRRLRGCLHWQGQEDAGSSWEFSARDDTGRLNQW